MRAPDAEELPQARREAAPDLLRRVQGGGNRAAASRLQRRPRGGGEGERRPAVPTLAAFDASNHGIIKALSYEQLEVWHEVIEGWTANRKVDDAIEDFERRDRANAWDPGVPNMSSAYQEKRAKLDSRHTFVDEASTRVTLDPNDILASEIAATQAWNVDAEQRFRTWALAEFAAHPLVAELSSRRELVSQLERTQNPGIDSGIPHVNLLWGGGRIRHTNGLVTWNDLMDIGRSASATRPRSRTGPRSRRCAPASRRSTRTSRR